MSLHSVRSINNLNDPLRQFQIRFTINRGRLNAVLGNNLFMRDTWEMRATSYTLPGMQVKQAGLQIMNFARKRATRVDRSGVWKVTIIDDYNGNVLRALRRWCDIMHNQEIGLQMPSTQYVTSVRVDLLRPTERGGGAIWHDAETVIKDDEYDEEDIDEYDIITESGEPAIEENNPPGPSLEIIPSNYGRQTWRHFITMRGVYPIKVENIPIKSSDSGTVEIVVEFNYDWFGRLKASGWL